jgi:hypothetical protein
VAADRPGLTPHYSNKLLNGHSIIYFRQRKGFFLFVTTSKRALGSPTQSVPGALLPGVKTLGHEVYHLPSTIR